MASTSRPRAKEKAAVNYLVSGLLPGIVTRYHLVHSCPIPTGTGNWVAP